MRRLETKAATLATSRGRHTRHWRSGKAMRADHQRRHAPSARRVAHAHPRRRSGSVPPNSAKEPTSAPRNARDCCAKTLGSSNFPDEKPTQIANPVSRVRQGLAARAQLPARRRPQPSGSMDQVPGRVARTCDIRLRDPLRPRLPRRIRRGIRVHRRTPRVGRRQPSRSQVPWGAPHAL